MFPHILHQMVKGHVIGNNTLRIWIIYLTFLGNTRADKSKLVCDPHIFLCVNRATHHRAVDRKQLRNQFRYITLNVSYDCGTRLRNSSLEIILLHIIQISPGCNVRTKRNTDNVIHAELFQPAQHTLIFTWIVGFEGRCQKQGNLFPLRQICKKSLRIVIKFTGIVFTGINAGSTGNASRRVDTDPCLPVHLLCNAGPNTAAGTDALIAAYTEIICKNQLHLQSSFVFHSVFIASVYRTFFL